MRRTVASLAVVASGSVLALVAGIYRADRERQRIITSGTIQAQFTNDACAALSPTGSVRLGMRPENLNDGKLDPVEERALREGCTLTAKASAPNGMPLTDVFVVLVRAEAPDGSFRAFSTPSRTDANGFATWRFTPTPNTHFVYEVTSPNPVGVTVSSKPLELQLCTGETSVGAIAGAAARDAGRGCRG